MTFPRGIQARLTLGLLALVGGALLVATLLVVPFLERALVDAKLDQLRLNAESTASALTRDTFRGDQVINAASLTFGVRIVWLDVVAPPLELDVIVDSAGGDPARIEQDPIAVEAARSGSAQGRVTRNGTEFAESAVQLFTGDVLLVSGSLRDQLETVDVVRRRLLVATIAALVIAGLLGAWAAALHAGRIRRIERAANRLAEGSFDEELVVGGSDELAQLAGSFDRMRKRLEQLDLARKEFVANASHELRTPLFSLAGFLELLADEEMDDATRAQFLARTREQVERLSRLATDLLDLSRIDAGHLRVEREEVDLVEIAETLGAELQPIARATDHRLVVSDGSPVWALADEERVLQIGRALAGNALTHTPPGSTVTLAASSRPGGVTLSVSDDGPGIPAEHRDEVFERFFRVDGTHAHGSGLGLAIARELAEKMGGTVVLEVGPTGTRFALTLPAVGPTGVST